MKKELSFAQSAKFLGISKQRAHKLYKDGRLKAHFVGNQLVCYESDLKRMADRKPGRPLKTTE